MSEILVVGSVAYDTISTPAAKKERTVGGSANYFSIASSLYTDVNVVGVVGEDFAGNDIERLESRGVNLEGLQRVPGKTFHWEGRYEGDMNEAITLDTQLNVFADFQPKLPNSYKNSSYLFLANIDPTLQMEVLDQVDSPRIVGVDTMNFWIDSKQDELKKLLSKVDVFLLNEGEAKKLANTQNAIGAAQELSKMGPKIIVIKRGEYGFLLYAENKFFSLPAYPIADVVDPTGAGDTFAGGFFGYLSKVNADYSLENIKQACIHGTILASFTVQGFGVEGIENLTWSQVEERHNLYKQVIS